MVRRLIAVGALLGRCPGTWNYVRNIVILSAAKNLYATVLMIISDENYLHHREYILHFVQNDRKYIE